jgi:hypothetical protein
MTHGSLKSARGHGSATGKRPHRYQPKNRSATAGEGSSAIGHRTRRSDAATIAGSIGVSRRGSSDLEPRELHLCIEVLVRRTDVGV